MSSFLVPFERDELTVGREAIIDEIEQGLALHGIVALDGVGGSGKTHLAKEYIYRFHEKNPKAIVIWLQAENDELLDCSCRNVARKLGLPNGPDIFRIISDWLLDVTRGNTLLVLDDFPARDDTRAKSSSTLLGNGVIKAVRQCSKVRAIITSRNPKELGSEVELNVIEVPLLSFDEATTMLQSKISPSSWRKPDAAALLKMLGYLPLAITLAAGFISENSTNLAEYAERVATVPMNAESDSEQDRARDSLRSSFPAWKLSFSELQEESPNAVEKLCIMAILERSQIPRLLLLGKRESEKQLERALKILQRYSFILISKDKSQAQMSRIVSLHIMRWLADRGEVKTWEAEVTRLLSESYPAGDFLDWSICDSLYPFVQVVTRYDSRSEVTRLQTALLLKKVGLYKRKQTRYDEAYSCCNAAITIYNEILKEEHPLTLGCAAELARILHCQGNYTRAEKLGKEVLTRRERVLGKEHVDTILSATDLADALHHCGKHEEAEKQYRRSVTVLERELGAEHMETLTALNSLASELRCRGKYDESELLFHRCLIGTEKALGSEHPESLKAKNNLAAILKDQANYKDAEKLYREVLESQENTLGKEHTQTMLTATNLAVLLKSQGRFSEAVEMQEEIQARKENVLGPEHPNSIWGLRQLATALGSVGRYGESISMHRRSLEMMKRNPETPRLFIAASKNNLAGVLGANGEYPEAEKLHEEALAVRKEELGPTHPDTLVSVNNLGRIYYYQGRFDEAKNMFMQKLDVERKLRPKHPSTMMTENNLGLVYQSQKNYEEAEKIHRENLECRAEKLGPGHPDTLKSAYSLAEVLEALQRHDEASTLYTQAFEGRYKAFGPDHPDVKICEQRLSRILDEEMRKQGVAKERDGEKEDRKQGDEGTLDSG